MSYFPAVRPRAARELAAVAAALSSLVWLAACTVQGGVQVQPPVIGAAVVVPDGAVIATAAAPPPPLPVYEQPPCPEEGYLWTPGNWQYGSGGYFWVPGTWVKPPQVGVLWTPGYWGYAAGAYGFHDGYWAPHIGFYGGVNYGFGYGGSGFAGGRWDGGHYAYNTAVNNVNVANFHNTYSRTVVYDNTNVNSASYNGGPAGLTAVPTAQERALAREPHIAPTPAQSAHILTASRTPALAARNNGGHPAIAATLRAGAFSGPGVTGALKAPPPRVLEAKEPSGPTERSGAAVRDGGDRNEPAGSAQGAKPPLPPIKPLAQAPDARRFPDSAAAPKAPKPPPPKSAPAKADHAGKPAPEEPHDKPAP